MRAISTRLKVAAVVVVILVVVSSVAAYLLVSGVDAPTFSSVSASSVRAGASCNFSVTWNSKTNVSGYVFGTNNTGVFVNETWASFSSFLNSTSAVCRVTKTLNGTIWNTVLWIVWSNDTDNHWASTGALYVFLDTDRILLKTSMGDIKIQLYTDMPITTGNFKRLVRSKIYDGTIFHRVIKGFMIQGGDPTGTGAGDPNIPAIPDEFTDHNRNDQWTVAMANAGPNTGSSQFFINLVNNDHLNTLHPVFGQVIAGTDVVAAIGNVQTDSSDKPIQPVVILQAIPVN